MARTQHSESEQPQGEQQQQTADPQTLWAEAAAAAGYAVNDNKPLVGISGDEGDGYIVELPAPEWFGAIGDEGTRHNVFRALASHALRVGQAAVKAADKPDRDVAITGVAGALNGAYKPSKERSNDILDREADRMFAERVRERALAKNPNTPTVDIEKTTAALYDTEQGKTLRAQFRTEILSRGTYTVSRKKGKASENAVDATDLL